MAAFFLQTANGMLIPKKRQHRNDYHSRNGKVIEIVCFHAHFGYDVEQVL